MNIEKTIRFDIFMAGDLAQAKQVCREYCFAGGLCVHVEAVDYIYTTNPIVPSCDFLCHIAESELAA